MQTRKKNGHFGPKAVRKGFLYTLFAVAFIAAYLFLGTMDFNNEFNRAPTVSVRVEPVAAEEISYVHEVTLDEKVAQFKDEVVTRLSKECEALGAKEPEGLIVFDTNGLASIGPFQFQVKTVQHYISKFEGREITRKEAIMIAIDFDSAYELAYKIIFDEVGGIWNWTNCANRLELGSEIEFIRKLES